ncbi:hypothetical protein [Ottowia sp. SB7-C50]|uniref:hypothetical protein n=1 Tax=Ottowia sp. SB7-C50 TaxID=3081231 RepID=UPI002955644F|nr:hypothetical protein [Ottowia sp. SB7-C50]WOP16857.1 hypothetical protein R0D99_07705 [Ottowia sp. SB7-C50]
MSKTISGRDGPTFGLENSLDVYNKLTFEAQRLRASWHPYDATNFLITAWHLVNPNDWPKSDPDFSVSRGKRDIAQLPIEMQRVLCVARDIANGSKHFQLKENSAKLRQVETVHSGHEVGWYQFFFMDRMPGVTVDEFWYFSVRALCNILMKYFEWVFDDELTPESFPEEIIRAIKYCHIPTRSTVSPPPSWIWEGKSAKAREGLRNSSCDVLSVAISSHNRRHEASRAGSEPDHQAHAQARVPGADGTRGAVGGVGGTDRALRT